jgi:hypothetical protein
MARVSKNNVLYLHYIPQAAYSLIECSLAQRTNPDNTSHAPPSTSPTFCESSHPLVSSALSRSEWPCRMRAAHNVSLASARNPHPPARSKNDISERVVNVVRAATITHRDLAQYDSNKLNRCRYSFSCQEETGGNAGGCGSRDTENTHAATVLWFRFKCFRSRCAHWRQQISFSTRH